MAEIGEPKEPKQRIFEFINDSAAGKARFYRNFERVKALEEQEELQA